MRCPCCDAPDFRPQTIGERIRAQAVKVGVVVTAVGVAVFGQAELLGEPWRHYVTIAAILVAVGVSVFLSFKESAA